MIDKNFLFSHEELIVGDPGFTSYKLASMSLEELREWVNLIVRLLEISRKLKILDYKYGCIISLDIMNPDPAAFAKRQSLFKPSPHPSLYRTVDYPTYRQFISRIESTASACKLDDAQIVAYASMGLDYIERELWNIHAGQIWQEMAEFLLLRLGDSASRIRNAWRALFQLRKRADEDEYQWLQQFEQQIREIGEEEFQNSDRFAKHLFL